MCWRPPQMATLLLVLAIAWILSLLAVQSDARFLEIGKRPPGTGVGIVASDETDPGFLHLDPALSSDSVERASEMISVKLFNQYHARSFDHAATDQRLDDTEPLLVDHRPAVDYETVNQLDADDGGARQGPAYSVDPGDTDAMDMKENVIDNDYSASIAPIAEQLDDWSEPATEPAEQTVTDPYRPTVATEATAAATATMTTLTTTTTSTITTVRKIRRKIRRKLSVVSPSTTTPAATTSTSTAKSTTARRTVRSTEPPLTTTMAARESQLPKLDITKLNLQHLEDEFLSYPSLAGTVSRVRPRSIKAAPEMDNSPPPPSCGCQHRKRAAPRHSYSYEDDGDGEQDYGDYDYVNDLRSRTPKGGAVLFPVMSRLLAPVAPDEHVESSVERAEKVHGALERLMGIVTIFSHVDEFIQKKTKQSIRRLARLYESEELY
ncbi:uncharacterized protein LOC131207333 [Anopheles bellator]|uniref:uncharacterized protein LOC131207333 n=1 Tax=Anopheles bellator TaxID=139047 RepID=UPI00264955CF|nr:uncharacterized protein LOC131207333 [Anopheles bellator]